MANPARIWDYWLGGKDNFAADRAAAEDVAEVLPSMPRLARASRRFLAGAVHQLAASGIRQFLDIGAGLPTADNTHEVAQRAVPECRVVYVDHDPVVISHARALLVSGTEGSIDYIHADLRQTSTILAQAARTLDFGRPVGVLLAGVLHFIPDTEDPAAVVADLIGAVPPGSCLVVGHAARDIQAGAVAQAAERYNERCSVPITPRSREQVARFIGGPGLISTGAVPLAHWPGSGPAEADLAGYCGIGIKR